MSASALLQTFTIVLASMALSASAEDRDLSVSVDEERVVIASSLEVGGIGNEIEFDLRTRENQGVSITMEYETEYENNNGSVEIELDMSVRLLSLIEFSGTPEYIQNTSVVEQEYIIGSSNAWNVTARPSTGRSFDTAPEIIASASDGVVTLIGHAFALDNASTTYSTTSFKFDVLINDFPWAANNSRLAIQFRLAASSEHEVEGAEEQDDTEVTMHMSGSDMLGVFEWDPLAEIDDSTPVALISSVREIVDDAERDPDAEDGDIEEALFVTIAVDTHFTSFVWDPIVRIESQAPTSSTGSEWSSSAGSQVSAGHTVSHAAGQLSTGLMGMALVTMIHRLF